MVINGRVLICGDRNWPNRESIRAWIEKLKDWGYDTLIEGEARGADTIAREEAENAGMHILESTIGTKGFPAKWEEYKQKYPIEKFGMKWKSAGTDRNTQMLVEGKPDLIVAFHNNISASKGTKNMIKQATDAGIKVILVEE